MSNDICKLLIQNRHIVESFKIMDDIDIGYAIHMLNIPVKILDYCFIINLNEFENKKQNIENKDFIAYKIKQTDRSNNNESIIMQNTVNILYNM